MRASVRQIGHSVSRSTVRPPFRYMYLEEGVLRSTSDVDDGQQRGDGGHDSGINQLLN